MPLRIGVSEVDITPPLGVRMAGFFGDRMVEGVHDPLFARAMALDNGAHPLIFVTCDLLSLKRVTVEGIKARIQEQTGVPPQSVMVSATHTHTGPATSRIFTRDPSPEYLALLQERVPQAAVSAWQRRQSARFGVGWGFEGRLSHNRRFMMRSTKQVVMHPPKGSTDILYQEGKVDPEVGVLSARAEHGEPLGCLLNFSCHVNVVGGAQVSADYPGYFAAAMKRRQGAQHVGLFANGCCANLCQIDVYDPDRRDGGHEWAQHMGERLAEDVERIEAGIAHQDDIELDSRLVELELPMRRVPSEQVAWAEANRENAEALGVVEATYVGMTFELLEQTRREPMVKTPIQAFRIGDVGMVMLPAEVFVEYGLAIKLDSPAQRTFVVELANGIVGYVPTREAFSGGGYEQRLGTNSFLCPSAGDVMVDTGLTLLDSMFR